MNLFQNTSSMRVRSHRHIFLASILTSSIQIGYTHSHAAFAPSSSSPRSILQSGVMNTSKPLFSRHFSKKDNEANLTREREDNGKIVKGGDEPPSKKSKKETERTQSFDPQWHGVFDSDTDVKVHTIMLGTHPSITSLAKVQYFGHPMNAFWWIAGDCLGFRRASGISPSSGKAYKLSSFLYHGQDKVISYDDQLRTFTSKGFALWDLVGSCEREGSLDVDIKQEQPNRIREFCKEHPTVKRIIFVNGGKQCTLFNKHFEDWWLSGELKPGGNELSEKAFKKFAKKINFENASVECLCMPAVSPAAAGITYENKRAAFEDFCYNPGLQDHKDLTE